VCGTCRRFRLNSRERFALDITVSMAATDKAEEILRDYPYVEKADFRAVYAYASQAGRERLSR
jgi:uncharacterized protein (DUF433 family)